MKTEQLNYTFILHQIRKKLKLSLVEYCIADSIYHLSNNPNNKIQGWCFASKEYIAEFLGVNSSTIFSNLNKIIKKGLVERDKDTRYLRTTQKWYENVVLIKMKEEYGKIQYPIGKSKSEVLDNPIVDYGKIQYNNNNYNNNNKEEVIIADSKESAESSFSFQEENKQRIKKSFEKEGIPQSDIFDWKWCIKDAQKKPFLFFIGLYWQEKNYIFDNQLEASSEISRCSKIALQHVKKYPIKKYQEMLQWMTEDAKERNYPWTMETIDKKLGKFNSSNQDIVL